MLRTAFMLLSARMLISALSLVRNLIVARLLSVEDYGVAATFALIVAVVEMASALGLQQQIVQSRDGDTRHFQDALQGFQVLRGVASGLMLVVIAGPFAEFMGTPQAVWAYRLMALVPVLNAFVHFDIHRRARGMVFWPMLLPPLVAALVSVAAIWPLVAWFGDWRVMLYSLILQALLAMAVSHLVAERPFRISVDRSIIARSLRFGWPIMVNGVLIFAGFNADRLIVGRELGMAALAIFSMGMTLTLTPTSVLAGSINSFFLPQLASAQENRARFFRLSGVVMELMLLSACLLALLTVILGRPVVDLLLGSKYAALLPLLGWFSIWFSVRMFKYGPSMIALAVGETRNAMIANLARALVVPLCWYVAATSGDLLWIIWIATAGEAASHLVALAQLRLRRIVSLRRMVLPHVAAALFLLAAGAVVAFMPPTNPAGLPPLPAILGLLLLFCGLVWVMRDLRHYVAHRRELQPRGWTQQR